MQSFSAKQRLHLEGWPLYERACFTMPHLIWKSVLLFLRSQSVFGKRGAICWFGIVKGRIMVVIARLKFLLSHFDVCFYITG